MEEENGDIVLHGEAEIMVKTLRHIPLNKIGSKEWKRQHEYLNKLNQQAQLNVHSQVSDYISEAFAVTHEIKTLVKDLLAAELWREKVVPIMIKTKDFLPKSTIPFYLSLYNEAVILNLLETISFNAEVIETIGDLAVDLVDYCYRTLSLLYAQHQNGVKHDKPDGDSTPKDIFNNFSSSMLLEYGPKCITILRYLSEAGKGIPLDAHTRIIRKLNVPQLLVALMEDGCGWIESDRFYLSGKWHKKSDPLSPHETGILLLLRQLLTCEDFASYELHQQNISALMRVQKFLTPTVLQFCSPLVDLNTVLSQMQVGAPDQTKSYSLLIESEPEIRDEMIQQFKDAYPSLAKSAMTSWANPSFEQNQKDAKELVKMWQIDRLELLMNEVPKCEVCGAESENRCSSCKTVWYCRRQCQIEHWTEHKKICEMLRQN